MHAFPFILLAGSLLSTAAWGAQKNEEKADGGAAGRLQEVERALDKGLKKSRRLKRQTDALTGEVKRLGLELVATARAIQNREAEVSGLEARLARLAVDEAEKYSGLERRRGQFTRVMMALKRLARIPPEALVVQPLSPSDTVRSAILLRTAVPEIERRADWLRQELNGLAHARRQIAARRLELSAAAASLKGERGRLALIVAKKKVLKQRTRDRSRKAERRVKALAGEAKSLRQLLARLDEERRDRAARPVPDEPPPGAAQRPITKARGKLPFPAAGRLVGRYGQATKNGLTRKGISVETRPDAQVVAPYDGRVVFADAFRGYGRLLIIDHGEGYHSLLAGLARIDTVIGQWVLAGEPVGVMGRDAMEKPILYVELRRKGQPINPLPWLAARKGKVSG
jgi:septal ring factor EnvC (AmiA/AmiB activator)